MNADEIRQALDELKQIQTAIDRASGRRAAALDQLKEEFKVDSLDEAQAQSSKLLKKVKRLEARAASLSETINEKFGGLL